MMEDKFKVDNEEGVHETVRMGRVRLVLKVCLIHWAPVAVSLIPP